ncbi:MAG: hypothetical protein ACI94Y_003544 [Maribacter sp.]|jgi:hypothetical protein
MKKIYLFLVPKAEIKVDSTIVKPRISNDNEYTYYEFNGSLEGDIPLEIHLNVFGKLIQGELFYKKVGEPIKVIGEVGENNHWRLLEYAGDGNI